MSCTVLPKDDDDDDDDEKEKEKEKERKKKAERRRVMLERAKKRLLGFREPVDKDKKEEGDARAEAWDANENPFWQPPMYVPAEGPCVEDFKIFTDEYVETVQGYIGNEKELRRMKENGFLSSSIDAC